MVAPFTLQISVRAPLCSWGRSARPGSLAQPTPSASPTGTKPMSSSTKLEFVSLEAILLALPPGIVWPGVFGEPCTMLVKVKSLHSEFSASKVIRRKRNVRSFLGVYCSAETYMNTTWPTTQSTLSGLGVCDYGFFSVSPSRNCIQDAADGSWSENVTNPCTGISLAIILMIIFPHLCLTPSFDSRDVQQLDLFQRRVIHKCTSWICVPW